MSPPCGKKPFFYTNVPKEKELYTRLLNLCRSPADSMQVVAFLMWLQTLIVTDVADLLIGELMTHPIRVMDAIAGEIMDCLKCVQNEIMPFTEGVYDVSLLHAFVFDAAKFDITLDYLYQNRRLVIKGVRKMVRAFNGLYDQEDTASTDSSSTANSTTAGSKFLSDEAGTSGSRANKGKATEVVERSVIPSTAPKGYVPYGRYRRDEEDGRTIFLIFSKGGYPIPANEIASFFNRKFGRSVVDKIYMKNIEVNEHVLYARMVCIEAATVDAIVSHDGGLIAKYIIRGMHVWARKYVKRYRSASA